MKLTLQQLFAVVGILVAGLFLSGCDKAQESHLGNEPSASATSAVAPPATPTAAVTTSTTTPVIRLDAEEPMAPLRGTIKAYEIREATQLTPGLLADGFIGDLVLENDLAKFVIRRPDPALPLMPPAGALIDVANKKLLSDYLNYLEPLPDVESTSTRIKVTRVVSFLVDKQTTARLILEGHVTQERLSGNEGEDSSEAIASAQEALPIRVVTSYELPKDTPWLKITTRFTNLSTETISLSPGDYIDWGEATTFIEGAGIGTGKLVSATWAGAWVDHFSGGICFPGEKPLACVASNRQMVVMAIEGAGQQVFEFAPNKSEPSKPGPFSLHAPASSPVVPASLTPAKTTIPAAPPRQETRYDTPRSVPIPPRETLYGYTPAAASAQEVARANSWELRKESIGGGDFSKKDQKQTTSSQAKAPASPRGRIVLAPGKHYEFTRYLIVGDRNLSRVSETAYKLKRIPTGVVAGLAVEEGSNVPLSGVEVRVSGGPTWNGKDVPYAFTKTLTRQDGSFVLRLPYGNYVITATKMGREMVEAPRSVSLYRKSAEQYIGLVMSKESRLQVAVSDPESRTSAPLPSRLVLIPKPGTEPVDWGYGVGSVAAVRNLAYMPFGGASLPVTPGQYKLYISRGPEYDAVEKDLVVTRGSTQKIIVTLPRAFTTPGLMSADLGVMTTASATALLTPADIAVMAACEGVRVVVTGDFDTATDITEAIRSLGLQQWVKCIPGMRFLVSGRSAHANILVYPVTPETAQKLSQFRSQHRSVAPDVFLADLRKTFPDLVIQVDQPLHPLAGYLAPIPFNDRFKRYEEGSAPPPDFHALQLLNGKVVAEFHDLLDRYFDLAVKRTQSDEPAPALTPVGSSMCRLPYGTELGYPRVYAYTIHDTIETFTPSDLSQAILNQRIICTNGLMPKVQAYSPATKTYAALPGDVVDTGTTGALPMRINILAASWISLSNFDLTWNGKLVKRLKVMPVKKVLRYPVRQQRDADIQYVYVNGDGFTNLICFSNMATLSPIVPPSLPDFGQDVWPLAWTGPIFVDQNQDKRIRITEQVEQPLGGGL